MSRQEKFLFLFQSYGDMIFRYCTLHTQNLQDAQDIYQEVFLKLYTKNPQFTDEEHAKAWLLRVSVNLCKNYHRSRILHPFVEFDETMYVTHTKQTEPDILQSLRRLSSDYRSVLYLYYFEGYQSKEIAALLHKPDATIRTWLSRGKVQLQNIIKEEELDEGTISTIQNIKT